MTSQGRPLQFFVLTFVLSLPLWLLGVLVVPPPDSVVMNLPVSALMFACPITAAALLHRRSTDGPSLWTEVRDGLDPRRLPNRAWLLVASLAAPFLFTMIYGLMRLLGRPLPEPHVPLLNAVPLFFLFGLAAVCEEVGWTMFAGVPLQKRWNAACSALVVGVVWAAWHVVPWLQMQRSAVWIAWYGLFTVALRMLLVWVYNSSGKRLLAPVVLHAMTNVCYALFPNGGSHFDPLLGATVMVIAAATVMAVGRPELPRG